ncbi:MAG: hypothetical protein V3U96_10300 [Paracoccaceae bacterium]
MWKWAIILSLQILAPGVANAQESYKEVPEKALEAAVCSTMYEAVSELYPTPTTELSKEYPWTEMDMSLNLKRAAYKLAPPNTHVAIAELMSQTIISYREAIQDIVIDENSGFIHFMVGCGNVHSDILELGLGGQ